jgi:hypothetical protein
MHDDPTFTYLARTHAGMAFAYGNITDLAFADNTSISTNVAFMGGVGERRDTAGLITAHLAINDAAARA